MLLNYTYLLYSFYDFIILCFLKSLCDIGKKDIFIITEKFHDLKVILMKFFVHISQKNVGKVGTIIKVHWCLSLHSFWCHLCCISGLTLIPGSRSLKWENDIYLQQIVWLMKKILLKLIAGTVKDMKLYILDLFKLQFLILTFGQGCAITVHCHQNEQLQRSHQTSGMAFSPILIQWIHAKLFAPSAGHESLEKDKWTAGAVIFEMPLMREIPEFTSKGTKTEYPMSPKKDWWKYGGISDGDLIPDTLEPFSHSHILFEG